MKLEQWNLALRIKLYIPTYEEFKRLVHLGE